MKSYNVLAGFFTLSWMFLAASTIWYCIFLKSAFEYQNECIAATSGDSGLRCSKSNAPTLPDVSPEKHVESTKPAIPEPRDNETKPHDEPSESLEEQPTPLAEPTKPSDIEPEPPAEKPTPPIKQSGSLDKEPEPDKKTEPPAEKPTPPAKQSGSLDKEPEPLEEQTKPDDKQTDTGRPTVPGVVQAEHVDKRVADVETHPPPPPAPEADPKGKVEDPPKDVPEVKPTVDEAAEAERKQKDIDAKAAEQKAKAEQDAKDRPNKNPVAAKPQQEIHVPNLRPRPPRAKTVPPKTEVPPKPAAVPPEGHVSDSEHEEERYPYRTLYDDVDHPLGVGEEWQ